MKMLTSLVLCVLIVLARSSVADAEVPRRLTQHGRLFDKMTSAPITGMRTLRFAVYTAPTGGVAVWNETHPLMFEDGFFSVQLGGTTAFPDDLWRGPGSRFLGVTVDDDEELKPREALTAVPYALVAHDVTGPIHPQSVSIGGRVVIDDAGRWVGDKAGIEGPPGVPCNQCVRTSSIANAAVTAQQIAPGSLTHQHSLTFTVNEVFDFKTRTSVEGLAGCPTGFLVSGGCRINEGKGIITRTLPWNSQWFCQVTATEGTEVNFSVLAYCAVMQPATLP